MEVYIIYRHYWPDITAYARLLRSIAERIAADGHHVTVFSAQPSYNDVRQQRRPFRERVNGVEIIRMGDQSLIEFLTAGKAGDVFPIGFRIKVEEDGQKEGD